MSWAPDYATLAELREYVTRSSETVDDAQLSVALTAASRTIDQECGRQFGQLAAPAARYYTPAWNADRGVWTAAIDDLMDATGLAITCTAGTVTAYTLEPRNAAADGRPWIRLAVDEDETNQPDGGRDELAVTALWGWSAVPTAVKQATLLQASRLYARRGSPFGVAGSPDLGNELRLLARVDPDVAVALRPYRRPRSPR